MERNGEKLSLKPKFCPANNIPQYKIETNNPIPNPTERPLLFANMPTGKAKKMKTMQPKGNENFL